MAKAEQKTVDNKPETVVMPTAAVQYGLLKDYVRRVRKYDLSKLAEELAQDPLALPAALADLGQATKVSYSEDKAEHLEFNKKAHDSQLNTLLHLHENWDKAQAVLRLGRQTKEHILSALESFCSIVESIEAQKGKNDSYQMRFGDKVVKGGWQATSDGFYDDVNLPPGVEFSKEEQDRVVFGIGKRDYQTMLGAFGLRFVHEIITELVDSITGKAGSAFTVGEVHIMFGFSAFVNYSAHRDQLDLSAKADITAMLSLAPGQTTMKVLGAEEDAEYKFPGDILAFDAVNMYHRSGACTARTVKLAFFIELTAHVALETSSEEEEDPEDEEEVPEVKLEVKEEKVKKEKEGEEDAEEEEEEKKEEKVKKEEEQKKEEEDETSDGGAAGIPEPEVADDAKGSVSHGDASAADEGHGEELDDDAVGGDEGEEEQTTPKKEDKGAVKDKKKRKRSRRA